MGLAHQSSRTVVYVLSLVLSLVALACTAGQQRAATPRARAPNAVAASLPRYAIDARVDPGARSMEVAGTVRVPAADSSRATIGVVLDRMMHGFRVDVLEPAVSAGPAIVDSVGVA